ncbi:hypothetical protein ABIB25_005641 [Nakamurella sp. UYEF19]
MVAAAPHATASAERTEAGPPSPRSATEGLRSASESPIDGRSDGALPSANNWTEPLTGVEAKTHAGPAVVLSD